VQVVVVKDIAIPEHALQAGVGFNEAVFGVIEELGIVYEATLKNFKSKVIQ
jgi:hypothetical protein